MNGRSRLIAAARAAALAGTLATVALVVAPASGSTIGVEPNPILGGDAVVYRAAPGEANQLSVLGQTGAELLFQEGAGGPPITPIPPCAGAVAFPGQTNFAQCPAAGVTGIAALLGDLPDSAGGMVPIPLLLDGEADNDTLTGGVNDDLLIGGTGNDVMLGEPGNDILDGGPGSDDLRGNVGAADDVGFDLADYSARLSSVTATLDGQRNDGEAGELDLLAVDMDDIDGGAADDSLTGDIGPNALFGNDGNDSLDGAAGADILDGGNGNDTILARDGAADSVACGPGIDTVVADAVDSVTGCESVSLPAAPPAPATAAPPAPAPRDTVAPRVLLARFGRQRLATVLRRGLRVGFTCSEACTLRGVVRYRGRRVASGTASGVAGLPRRLTLRFTRAAKRPLRRVRSAQLALTITATDASGNRRTTTRTLTLRR